MCVESIVRFIPKKQNNDTVYCAQPPTTIIDAWETPFVAPTGSPLKWEYF